MVNIPKNNLFAISERKENRWKSVFLSRLTRCLALFPFVTTLNESYLRIGGMSPQGRGEWG